MSRNERIDFAGARHHVMNRAARREAVFNTPEVCAGFLHIVGRAVERHGIRVHGFALMPNHYHLMIESVRGNVSAAMRDIGALTTRLINSRRGHDGPVFRGRFRNRLVLDGDYWQHLLLYLHLNPVRGHLVANPDDSIWTSHAAYAGHSAPEPWLTLEELSQGFDGPEGYRRSLTEAMRTGARGPSALDPANLWSGPASAVVPRPLAPQTRRVEDAIGDVLRVTGTAEEDLQRSVRGPGGNRTRALAAWWAATTTEASHREIGAFLGGLSASAVGRLIRRVRADRDAHLRAWRYALLG